MDDLGVPPFQETSIYIHLNDTLCSVDILSLPLASLVRFLITVPGEIRFQGQLPDFPGSRPGPCLVHVNLAVKKPPEM